MSGREGLPPRALVLLDFWFGTGKAYGAEKGFWWSSTVTQDDLIRDTFGGDYERALKGEYAHWASHPYSALALVLLFDQIPRNIFRGRAETYRTDDLALETSKGAIHKGFDSDLELSIERKFLYMPFAHSENMEDQDRALQLFKTLDNEGWYNYAKYYHNIISTFRRFPHRNTILHRQSTPQEIKFLTNH